MRKHHVSMVPRRTKKEKACDLMVARTLFANASRAAQEVFCVLQSTPELRDFATEAHPRKSP